MLGAPGAYAAWVEWLDAFGRGEDRPADHLRPVDAGMGPQMLDRLLGHVQRVFRERQHRWNDVLLRDLRALNAQSTSAIEVMLTSARTRLAPLRAFADHPGFPEDLRALLRDGLAETVRSAQSSLEDSTRRAPFEVQSAVRRNKMTVPLAPPPTSPAPAPAPGRRVIL
ncbi:hypothetical protein [Actinocrispum wychmicini]|uniref:Uncharacterized protein n=1 Tax=Actinocrispum wychmicini TaxID=1213861 RepID=A0A4R2JIM9_9PSEU|nr:hypothetical protein [Actinocrispum wychmicini]TCO59751.1 hypothetical protein EV192_104594 [Actinocrispum wychmicini]